MMFIPSGQLGYKVHLFPVISAWHHLGTLQPSTSYTIEKLLWDPINSISQSQSHECYRKWTLL